ncbi:MAG TPA: glycine zipper 2TM domain-containing protein [Steroidobacteraceae bacterium]|nr:glycine zipper 2TM domain-containing protein [Steroidobacteraceae bacterium]
MNKSLLTGLVAGAAVATAGGVFATRMLSGPEFAQVVAVAPIMKAEKTARQVCEDVAVTHTAEAKDKKKIAGTVIGAVVGGVLGNQVGGGDGRKVATVAGAAAGGYAGNRIQDRMQKGNTYETTEQRCQTVYDTHEKQVGYDVRYRLDGVEKSVTMDHHPGERIPVQDGQLVLTQPEPTTKT